MKATNTNTGNEHAAGATVNRMASSAHEAVDKVADATNHAADSLSKFWGQSKGTE